MADLAGQRDIVIHQALYARHRRRLVDEIRKIHLDMPGFRLQFFEHFAQHGREILDGDFAFVAIENLHEARHVRALEIVRKTNVHIEHGDGMLHAARLVEYLDRVTD